MAELRSRGAGLDLVLAGAETSEALVLSPLEGSIAWAFEPGDRTGCISVLGRDGRFSVMLCHVMLDRAYRRGERIARGQPLGVVGPAGTVGNNGTPHIHMELHFAGRSSSPVPFGAPDDLPFEGVDLPASGATNEHASVVETSTTAISAPPVSIAPIPTPLSGTTQSATRCAFGTSPRFVFGFADLKTRLGDAMGTPLTCEFPDPNGTGDVHQRTTKGLALWRKGTNTPTFTNGYEHWGKTPTGWVYWLGESIDPPANAG